MYFSSPGRGARVKSGISFVVITWRWHVLPGGTEHPDHVLPHIRPVDRGEDKLGAAAETDNFPIRSLETVFWQSRKGTCFALIVNTAYYFTILAY